MTCPDEVPARHDLTVHVCAPFGRDARLIIQALEEAAIPGLICSVESALEKIGREDCGPLLMVEEALGTQAINRLTQALQQQPDWSEHPLILLESPSHSRLPGTLPDRPGITLLRRPLSARSLVSVVRSAIETRRRQYEVRDLLHHLSRLNDDLRHQADQLQRLGLQLTEAEHEERKRIARILHDHLQQLLVATKMHLHLRSRSEQCQDDRQIQDLIDESISVSRNLATDLHPPLLDDATLEECFNWLASRKQRRYGLNVTVRFDGRVGCLPKKVQVLLLDSARELLFNVVKHAGTNRAELHVMRQPGQGLTLVVKDEGRGFDPDNMTEQSLGIFRIRQRLQYLGGRFDCQSRPDHGCHCEMFVPESLLEHSDTVTSESEAAQSHHPSLQP
ncbi:MAG: hypothetical protein IT445_10830 [Phycisphaeraceae bacterium]|nr:hypothetical protein [Phycisphaeraceae bacterium]